MTSPPPLECVPLVLAARQSMERDLVLSMERESRLGFRLRFRFKAFISRSEARQSMERESRRSSSRDPEGMMSMASRAR